MDDSRVKDVRALLTAFFDDEKLNRGGRYAEFFDSWRSVVGERLAAHSRIVDLDKGILIVEAEHPGWIQLLQVRQTQTLDALAERFPDLALRGIAFKLAGSDYRKPAPQGGTGRDEAKPSMPPESEETEAEERISEGGRIRDPELAAAIASLRKAIHSHTKK
jgi:hypothetical protein